MVRMDYAVNLGAQGRQIVCDMKEILRVMHSVSYPQNDFCHSMTRGEALETTLEVEHYQI